jgi:hypothetical protein
VSQETLIGFQGVHRLVGVRAIRSLRGETAASEGVDIMKTRRIIVASALVLWATSGAQAQTVSQSAGRDAVTVTPDNFIRAETDLYFGNFVRDGGFGKFKHNREPTPIDQQAVIRMNRDTLYSVAVFDLDAGPVAVTMPDAGKRFMSMQIINQDHFAPMVIYRPGNVILSKDRVGTRYVAAAVRTLVDPVDLQDMQQVHALQDGLKVSQPGVGKFEVPNWDQASQKKVRDALLALGATLPDSKQMFGTKDQVDPVRHLIGTAVGWGGNPDKEAMYLMVTPAGNDGKSVSRLKVGHVPVDGFWSVTVYDAAGYFEKNAYDAYSLNNITAQKAADGSITVQFGGCDGKVANCLPIMSGWNYAVRLYRPRAEILNGTWKFPDAQPALEAGTIGRNEGVR